jgi:hypothetical protein
MVTMRSFSGMKPDMTFSNVVLPEPVPPEITTLRRAFTTARNNSTNDSLSVPKRTKSAGVNASTAKRRIDNTGPSIASGGMMTLTREPSLRRASTIGCDSSIRRPTAETIRSMMFMRCASS